MGLSADEFIVGMIYLIGAPHCIGWASYHTWKMYSDLYTTDRKAVGHRRNPPPITKLYKRMAWLTTCSLWFWALTCVCGLIASSAATSCGTASTSYVMLTVFFLQCAKCSMYIVYILRLHQCYAQSAFGYNKKRLACVAIFLVVTMSIYGFGTVIGIAFGDVLYRDADGEYPHTCSHSPADGVFIAFAGLSIFTDFVVTIGAIAAFIIPINRLIKAIRVVNENHKDHKRHDKMLYVGYKYKVCVITASLTTITWMALIFGGTRNSVVAVWSAMDYTINMFCIMFMTAYYPDDKYYQKFCYLCICCCECKKSYKSGTSHGDDKTKDEKQREIENTVEVTMTNASSTGQTQTHTINTVGTVATQTDTKSIDTMDAPKVVATEDAPSGNLLVNDTDK